MKALELKIPPPAVFLVFAGAMLVIARSVSVGTFALNYQTETALAITVVALCFDGWALIRFYKAKTTINPLAPEKASDLVTTGVYRYSRNPMYVSLFVILVAWGVWQGNILGFAMLPLYVLYINRFQIMPEERVLLQLFGDEYQQYRNQVRRWI